MNERQTAWERVEDVDAEVVLFGFLSADVIITLLMFLPFVVFGGYVLAVALPPLLPTVVAVVTGVVGAALLSIRRVAWQVEPADEGANPPEADSMAVFLLSMFRVPTMIVGRLVLVVFALTVFVVFDRNGIAPVTVFVGVEGLIALALGSLLGIRVAVSAFVAECGEVPDGLGGRFWMAKSAALAADLNTDPRGGES
jgi:hypothetical protein